MTAVIHINGPNENETFTAATFLDYMRKSAPHWWEGAENSFDCPWVFRGQSDTAWPLIPTAARPNFEGVPEFKEIVQQSKLELKSSVKNWESFDPFHRDKFVRLFAHEKCIRQFLHLANDIGKNVPDLPPRWGSSMIDTAHHLVSTKSDGNSVNYGDFGASYFFSDAGSNFHPLLASPSVALAQHHGIPTFLLDWTRNPITSCHFASSGNLGENGLAVWALNISPLYNERGRWMDDLGYSLLGINAPKKSDNEYLSNQSGVLTFLPEPDELWNKNRVYPDLELALDEYYKQKHSSALGDEASKGAVAAAKKRFRDNKPLLKKMILKSVEVPALRRLLLREGVSKAHMMPSLDNIASTALEMLKQKL